jgi:putative flippase GtrA
MTTEMLERWALPIRVYASQAPDDSTPEEPPAPEPEGVDLTTRVRRGLTKWNNWIQLAKFSLIGASGYVVNLTTFAFCHEVLSLHHLLAATAAFLVAVTNNFLWNRHWTFNAGSGRARTQAPRFLVVSLLGFLLAAVVLDVLVNFGGVPAVPAQALAIAAATPINFLGNKLWTFDVSTRPER